MGYGIIVCKASKMALVAQGVIKLSKYDDHALRLKIIFDRVIGLIDEFHPDELSIEAPFFGKNVQSMLKLGRAQGVSIAAALSREIPYTEYAPRKIKQAVTGNGNASKEQVAKMIQSLLSMKELTEYLDASDALGAAICHYFQGGNNQTSGSTTSSSSKGSGSAGSWKAFLTQNPKRKIS